MRAEGWEAKLAAYLEAAPAFRWGEADCALWAAGWVAVCTGKDYTRDWRGAYKTERGAKARMTRLGFAGVAAIADRHLPAQPPAFARRGDLALHPQGALGVCNGLNTHFLTATGMTTLPTLACPRSWRVD